MHKKSKSLENQMFENEENVDTLIKEAKVPNINVQNPDYGWMRRLIRLQKSYILRVNQTQYEV